ncbi:condensation domain-containing protein, partial [Streptomyces sp. NPDC054901]
MNHLQLLREMGRRGLSVTLTDGDLRLQGNRDRMDPEFISRVKAAKPALVAHLAREAEHGPGFPLTPLQRGYYAGRSGVFEIGDVASHVFHEIEGHWDVDRLQSALGTVVAAHSALRSRFLSPDRQVTEHGEHTPRIGVLDLRAHDPRQQELIRTELREMRSHQVLPADQAPLLTADVTLLADDRMVLHVGHDGLVMDGISMFLFFRAWWHAYRSPTAEAPEELPFEDYVAALETARDRAPARRSRDYWTARADDLAP